MKVANGKDEYFLIKVGDEEIDEPTNITEPDQAPRGNKTDSEPGPRNDSTEPDQASTGTKTDSEPGPRKDSTEPDQASTGTKTDSEPGPRKDSTEPDQVVKTDNVKNTNEKKKGKKGEVGTGNDYGVSREFYLFLFLT